MNLRRRLIAAFAVAAIVSTYPAVAQSPASVRDTSYVAADGTRVLQHVVVIPATMQQVWDAFATTAGAAAWVAPLVHVDFRLGGIWESSYRPDAKLGDPGNIQNRFVSYRPPQMISMQVARTPPGFPYADVLKSDIVTVLEFKELGPKEVEVTESMVGFRANDKGHETILGFFRQGNAEALTALRKRFIDGPIDFSRK
ncbi:MAG: SRPBCC domain-containing protein [Acidobacteriota bacterium]|nr:SRPBCC domain-containing protein [Acidobacteriota bacterium]